MDLPILASSALLFCSHRCPSFVFFLPAVAPILLQTASVPALHESAVCSLHPFCLRRPLRPPPYYVNGIDALQYAAAAQIRLSVIYEKAPAGCAHKSKRCRQGLAALPTRSSRRLSARAVARRVRTALFCRSKQEILLVYHDRGKLCMFPISFTRINFCPGFTVSSARSLVRITVSMVVWKFFAIFHRSSSGCTM